MGRYGTAAEVIANDRPIFLFVVALRSVEANFGARSIAYNLLVFNKIYCSGDIMTNITNYQVA